MKRKHLFLLLLMVWGAVTGLRAQNEEINRKAQAHFQRLDSISKQLEKQLQTQLNNLPSDSIPTDQLNKILDHYADDWDYALFWEMERFRKDLGAGTGQENESEGEDATQIFRQIIKIIPKDKKSGKKEGKKTPTKKVKVTKARTHVESIIRWGLNNTMDPTDSTGYSSWGSKYISLGLEAQIPFDKHGHVQGLLGLGVMWNKLRPNGNYYHRVINDKVYLINHANSLTENKLRSSWLYTNLGLRFNPGKRYSFGAEVYSKYHLTDKQKLAYKDNYAAYETSEKRDFKTIGYNYGFTVFAGTRGLQFSFGMDFLPYFQNQNFRLYQIGIILR